MTESNERTDPLGSVADEALKMLDALQQRVGRELGKGFVKGAGSSLGNAFTGSTGRPQRDSQRDDVWGEAVSGHDHDEYICRACPVCRVIAARKEAGGDVTDHLVAAGGELYAALRQAVDALQRPSTTKRPDDSRVEHIDLG